MSITRARLECRAASKGNAAVQAGAKKERERWYEQILQALLRHVDLGLGLGLRLGFAHPNPNPNPHPNPS